MVESAAERRARLKAMRDEAEASGQVEEHELRDSEPQRQESGKNASNSTKDDEDEPVLKFRNYVVKDEKDIAFTKVEPAKVPEMQEIVVDPEAVIGTDPEDVLINVAPKKANWELRRAIAPQLARLDRKTQEAMIALMQQEQQHA